MSEEILNNLLKEYRENHMAMVNECKSVDEQIANLQSYRNSLTQPWEQILREIETNIRVLMFDRKESFKSEFGRVTYYKAGVRRSWSLDSLDMVCNANPIVKQFIWGSGRKNHLMQGFRLRWIKWLYRRLR